MPQTGLTSLSSSGLIDYGSSLYGSLLEPRGIGMGYLGLGSGLTGMGLGLTGMSAGLTGLTGGLGSPGSVTSLYSSPSSKASSLRDVIHDY